MIDAEKDLAKIRSEKCQLIVAKLPLLLIITLTMCCLIGVCGNLLYTGKLSDLNASFFITDESYHNVATTLSRIRYSK
ncbi:MAG: hypothetical protein ACOX2O_00175 [Bdellovibrionota bacterium]|jgi:hypothetical protein